MKKEPKKDNTFCYYPFHELTLKMWNDGKLQSVSPCCMMLNESFEGVPISNLSKMTPDEIFNSKAMNELRKDMLNNKRNPACSTCWNLEDNNQTSFRMFSDPLHPVDTKYPTLDTLDITLSNLCNLRCRMCDLTNSNQISKDYDILEEQGTREEFSKITSSMSYKRQRVSVVKTKQYKWLYRNTDKIKKLKASGGEPFYDKNIVNLLKKYIKNNDAKNTTLHFHTNATMLDERILNILQQFKHNNHTFSIDGTGKVYEYVRHQADWKQIENNIQQYIKLDNVDRINLNMVVSAHNIHNVCDYIRWAQSFDYNYTLVFSDVYPKKRGIHLNSLPKYILEPVYEELQTLDVPKAFIQTLNEILVIAMSTEHKDYNSIKLYRETVILDNARNQTYKDYLYPQMVKYLNGIEQMYLTFNKE